MSHYSEENLMRRIAAGDEQSFTELYHRYAPRMMRFFTRMFNGDNAKAGDFVQDLFLKIIEKPTVFNVDRNFKTWIYAVALNQCRNAFRDQKHFDDPDIALGSTAAIPERLPIDGPLFRQALDRALETLEAPHRDCFVLRYQEELSVKEISEIVGCPEGPDKSRIFHALKKLSQKLHLYQDILKN